MIDRSQVVGGALTLLDRSGQVPSQDPINRAKELRSLQIAFVATCPPRQCGIATFSRDLVQAIKAADSRTNITWAAIDEPDSNHTYGPGVRWRIRQGRPASYRAAAEQINATEVDLVCLQHEFGLYGLWGETFEDHLAFFLEALRKPLVTTLHTVLPEPSPSVRAAVQRIGRHSQVVVAMNDLARDLLIERYELDPGQIHVVPHGVPNVQRRGRHEMKERLGLVGRAVISTFGLVDPRKGLEYMIRAMPAIVARHPEALYLIVGKTHPELARHAGEVYRSELTALVSALGLQEQVSFVDSYLTQAQIVDYLLASDIYVTPYLDPNQITSGTLAYALGAGKAIISTPYLHATEVLSEGRGLLVDFRNSDQLATAALRLLDDPALKESLEQRTYSYGRQTVWSCVGMRMLELFQISLHQPRLSLATGAQVPVDRNSFIPATLAGRAADGAGPMPRDERLPTGTGRGR